MPWENRKIENRMRRALDGSFDQARAQHLFGLYADARRRLLEDVYRKIPVVEPNLTDHTDRHIMDVLDSVDYLLARDAFEAAPPSFSAADAYTLCLAVLFHDAGMVYGREDHEAQVAKVYDLVRTSPGAPLQEKALVYRIALAHTGTTDEGSKDTIAAVPETMDLDGDRVKARELAAILRFADELAEGPQRTSAVLGTAPFNVAADSVVFHRYASISNVHIDRDLGRIALTYRFDMSHDHMDLDGPDLRQLLEFTFYRAAKVDRERRYARFYSRQLAPFNRTEIVLNFWGHTGLILDLALELSAKTALDGQPTSLGEIDSRFDVGQIIGQLQDADMEAG